MHHNLTHHPSKKEAPFEVELIGDVENRIKNYFITIFRKPSFQLLVYECIHTEMYWNFYQEF